MVLVVSVATIVLRGHRVGARAGADAGVPSASLHSVSTVRLPGSRPTPFATADSNSPSVWTLVDGVPRLSLFTSFDGYTSVSHGTSVSTLPAPTPVVWDAAPPHGTWFESVLTDESGAWYGFYHNEVPPTACEGTTRMVPRIGAAVSRDDGATWQNLGIILETPPGAVDCQSRNGYFLGGVGDFSVLLDRMSQDLYFYFSTYEPDIAHQGVAVARLAWADREAPVGRVTVWAEGTWLPASDVGSPDPGDSPTSDDPGVIDGEAGEGPEFPEDEPVIPEEGAPPSATSSWLYPSASPIFPTSDSWHDGTRADAFWGPSVHWNTYLEQYVMLLNRTRDTEWSPDGVYVSFSPTLDDPSSWSTPQRILEEGSWYPQVMGLEPNEGTDKVAGQTARFFMAGISRHIIVFSRP